jgi:hypothetical protein
VTVINNGPIPNVLEGQPIPAGIAGDFLDRKCKWYKYSF